MAEETKGPKIPAVKDGKLLLTSPIGGVVKTTGRESQPEGTCWDALNVLPYDQGGRKRVAQRTGTVKQFPDLLGSGSPVTGLTQVVVATAMSGSVLFNEPWNYTAGNLTAVTSNWTLNSGGAAAAFKTSGVNTAAIDNTVSTTSTTVVDSTSVGVGSTYAVNIGVSLNINTAGADGGLVAFFGIGEPGTTSANYVGPQVGFTLSLISGTVAAFFVSMSYRSGSVNNATVNTGSNFPGTSFTGTFTLQVTEASGTTTMKLLQNGTQILTTSFAHIASSHHFFMNTVNSGFTLGTSAALTVTNTGMTATSGSGGGLPLDEKWAYTAGNLVDEQTLWVRQHPHATPAGLWVIPGGGGQVNLVPALAVGKAPGVTLINYDGPLTGLGPVFTVASNITFGASVPLAINDLVEYQLVVGVPTGGVRYELHVSFNSTDGVTWIPLILLNIWNKTKLMSSTSATPSAVTNLYTGVLQLIVDESTVGGTTLTVKDRGTTVITTQTSLTPASITVAWGVFATPPSSGLLANVSCVQGEFQISPGTTLPDVNVIRSSTLIATSGGKVYVGKVGEGSSSIALAAGQASPPLAPAILPGIAGIFQKAYLVDGSKIVQVDVPTATVETYTATAGSAPTGCRFACSWRGRLVLAGDPFNPQNFYMSRAGTPTDWDYSQTDPLAAIVGNASTFGQIGQPITALIPFSDDTMILGCSHSIWIFQGDPADGGTLISISDNMGIVAPRAWCKDTTGNLYFIGTGGLFMLPGVATLMQPIRPMPVSHDNWDAYFRTLNPASDYMNMTFDSDTHYLHIFVTPSSGGQGVHLTIDDRNKGFWPVQFPVMHGPVAVCQFFGDYSANTRSIMLGGLDGYIRKLDDAALDDDGTAISAYVVLGPVHPSPQASLLKATTIDFGELLPNDEINNPALWNVVATLRSGASAYDVTEGTPNQTYSVNCTLDGRTKTFRQRLRGGWFSLMISNGVIDTYFAFEQAELELAPAGRNRGQR